MSGNDRLNGGHPRSYNVYDWVANNDEPVAEFGTEEEAIYWLADSGFRYQSGNSWVGAHGEIYWIAGQRSSTVNRMVADGKLRKTEGSHKLTRVESEEL